MLIMNRKLEAPPEAAPMSARQRVRARFDAKPLAAVIWYMFAAVRVGVGAVGFGVTFVVFMYTRVDPLYLYLFIPMALAFLTGVAILALDRVSARVGNWMFERWVIETWRGGRPSRCLWCGYDLRGTPGEKCSECGESIPRIEEVLTEVGR